MDKTAFEKLQTRIDSYADEAIRIQREITAIPALAPENGGDGEWEKSRVLLSYIQNQLKFDEILEFNAPDDRVESGQRPNIVARIKGKNRDRTIWIMSHMDVVPPGDLAKWQGDPWSVRVEDGRIYGRGTEDNQQGIVSSLLMARALNDENLKPEYDVALLLVSDEETGSDYGIKYLLKEHGALFGQDDYIIIPDAGNAEGTLVEVAEKSIFWFKFVVLGKQTHGSTPELGVNACKAGAALIVKLERLYNEFNATDEVFEPPISTFEPTKREANVPNINTIPGEDIFYLDCRLLPDYKISEVRKAVQRICTEAETDYRVKVETSEVQLVEAPAPTPAEAPVVKAVQAGILAVKGVQTRPMGIGGGTVAAFFRAANLPAVVWATQDEVLHEPNEYAKIENILNDAKVFAHVVLSP